MITIIWADLSVNLKIYTNKPIMYIFKGFYMLERILTYYTCIDLYDRYVGFLLHDPLQK